MKLRLKREWLVIFTILGTLLAVLFVQCVADTYGEYLHQCDTEKGYTCNIFGK